MVRMRMRNWLLLVAGSVFAACTSSALAQSTAVDDSLKMGTDAIRSGHVQDAETYFKAALRADPQNPQALMGLGVSELRLGKPDDALGLLKRATEHDPAPGGAYLFLGIAYAQMHRIDECVAALRHEVEIEPKDTEAYLWLGIVELQDGHPEKATEPLDRAAELSPNDLNILQYRGKAHSAVAFASYARMAVIDPNSWHVHDVQGELDSQQKLHKEAIAEFLAAIKLAPQNADLYEELGNEYRKASTLELAQQAFQKELELSPNNPIAMYNLGKMDIETNRVQEGLGLLKNVIANYANVPATYFYLGLGELDEGNMSDALAALEKARALHPEPELAPRVEYELSRVYRKLGRIEESNHAVQEYTRLRAQNSKLNPDALTAISEGFGSAAVPVPESKGKN